VPEARSPVPILVGIGIAAGFFSALFGVGGGIVVVPLLISLLSFQPKPATGTSLGAIGITAGFGVVAYLVLGEVHWDEAAMIGLPAVLGGLAGIWIQQRVSSRMLVLLFAVFLVLIAIRLLLL
jgi:uncharacterized membrane protein YfcA